MSRGPAEGGQATPAVRPSHAAADTEECELFPGPPKRPRTAPPESSTRSRVRRPHRRSDVRRRGDAGRHVAGSASRGPAERNRHRVRRRGRVSDRRGSGRAGATVLGDGHPDRERRRHPARHRLHLVQRRGHQLLRRPVPLDGSLRLLFPAGQARAFPGRADRGRLRPRAVRRPRALVAAGDRHGVRDRRPGRLPAESPGRARERASRGGTGAGAAGGDRPVLGRRDHVGRAKRHRDELEPGRGKALRLHLGGGLRREHPRPDHPGVACRRGQGDHPEGLRGGEGGQLRDAAAAQGRHLDRRLGERVCDQGRGRRDRGRLGDHARHHRPQASRGRAAGQRRGIRMAAASAHCSQRGPVRAVQPADRGGRGRAGSCARSSC